MSHAEIDKRMKENYEFPYRIKLTKRVPVIVRIDGKAFHTFTKKLNKPFDDILITSMQSTMRYLCENVMGCKVGYCQSDEISLLLTDYDTLQTQSYFDYSVQKIASICASMATLEFNKAFKRNSQMYIKACDENKESSYLTTLTKAVDKGAMFDARCFNIPREEVTNYFYSRQIDAARNSIQMVGRAYFSHKELHKKSTSTIRDMLFEERDINWYDLPTELRLGACCTKEEYLTDDQLLRSGWVIDHDIPAFKNKGREYIERFVNIDE